MPPCGELIRERGRLVVGSDGRRIEDHADARDAWELMRLHDDRIVPGGGAGSWR
jgi:hypothetical protein